MIQALVECIFPTEIAMRHSLAKFVFILVLVKIDQLDSRAVEVVYTGQGCECAKSLPYHVNVPVPPEPANLDCRSYEYKVEVPVQTKAKYSYSFDVVVEEPVPPAPKPICKENLFAAVDKIAIPKPDCVMEIAAPSLPPPPPPPMFKACQYDKTKVCTCGSCPKIPDFEYEVIAPAPSPARPCLCGQCKPSNPQCRYVLSDFQTNHIDQLGGRSKRDVSSKKSEYMRGIRDYMKNLQAARVVRKAKKPKLVKRDIKGEYDLLQKDQAALDLTIPEIIQYMPETLKPDFQRGKCNIGCNNSISKHQQEEPENKSSPETANSDDNQQSEQSIASTESSNQSTQTLSNQQFDMSPQYTGSSYLKRSVDPYQYPYPYYPSLMPPPYIPNPLHLATLAQNPGNPIWYQPRPLIDPNGDYVYDRLGHKYEVKNGSLRLIAPDNSDEVNVSAPATASVANNEGNVQSTSSAAEQVQGEINTAIDQQQRQQAPVVGAPARHDSTYDPQMDKVIRDIIYQHPDFVDATEHAQGSLTQPQEVQSEETMQFLGKLIRGRLNNWFGVNEEVPSHNLQDLNRYSRETGTSIKFIPVVTVDKDKLNKYRQVQTQITT